METQQCFSQNTTTPAQKQNDEFTVLCSLGVTGSQENTKVSVDSSRKKKKKKKWKSVVSNSLQPHRRFTHQPPLSMGFSRLEWVAIPSSRGSSWPRDSTWVSCITDRFFTIWATREAPFFPGAPNNLGTHCWRKNNMAPASHPYFKSGRKAGLIRKISFRALKTWEVYSCG